jgi:hypothetical protein
MSPFNRNFTKASIVIIALFLSSCSAISLFDQYAYTQTTSLKVDALAIMDKATESYASHETEVEAVRLKMEKAYEYENHRAKNLITAKLWDILKSPDKNLYGGFVKRWKNESTLNAEFVKQAKGQISEAFDIIAELESQKIKPADDKVGNFFNSNK